MVNRLKNMSLFTFHAKGEFVKFEDLDPAYRVQAVIAVGNADILQDIDKLMKAEKFEEAGKMLNELIERNFAMILGFAKLHGLEPAGCYAEVLAHIHKTGTPPHDS
jgi:hypothetical protein